VSYHVHPSHGCFTIMAKPYRSLSIPRRRQILFINPLRGGHITNVFHTKGALHGVPRVFLVFSFFFAPKGSQQLRGIVGDPSALPPLSPEKPVLSLIKGFFSRRCALGGGYWFFYSFPNGPGQGPRVNPFFTIRSFIGGDLLRCAAYVCRGCPSFLGWGLFSGGQTLSNRRALGVHPSRPNSPSCDVGGNFCVRPPWPARPPNSGKVFVYAFYFCSRCFESTPFSLISCFGFGGSLFFPLPLRNRSL